jgi:hypothetical protein
VDSTATAESSIRPGLDLDIQNKMLLNYSSEEAAERGIYLVREDKISCYTC